MIKTQLIIKKTNFLTSSELKEILYLKNTFWKYGLNSQFKWFKKYVKSNDYNFLLFLKNKMIGYTLLRKRKYKIKKKEKNFFLLDTIIIEKKYRYSQYGSKLIKSINNFIYKKKIISILFCKKKIVNFYTKNNWYIIPKKNIPSSFYKKDRIFLILNKKIIKIPNKNKIFFKLN